LSSLTSVGTSRGINTGIRQARQRWQKKQSIPEVNQGKLPGIYFLTENVNHYGWLNIRPDKRKTRRSAQAQAV
jgi:hypothetical protein